MKHSHARRGSLRTKGSSSKQRAGRRKAPPVIAREYSSPPCFSHEIEGKESEGQCDVRIKRIYEKASRSDGLRVLVDRLWPRGVRKEDAEIKEWLKDLAPSTALRKWFSHEPGRWDEFRRRYRTELKSKSTEIARLCRIARRKRVTLLYAARDAQLNHAAVLQEFIQETPPEISARLE